MKIHIIFRTRTVILSMFWSCSSMSRPFFFSDPRYKWQLGKKKKYLRSNDGYSRMREENYMCKRIVQAKILPSRKHIAIYFGCDRKILLQICKSFTRSYNISLRVVLIKFSKATSPKNQILSKSFGNIQTTPTVLQMTLNPSIELAAPIPTTAFWFYIIGITLGTFPMSRIQYPQPLSSRPCGYYDGHLHWFRTDPWSFWN